MTLIRNFTDRDIESLQSEELFTSCLQQDCREAFRSKGGGDVFPAVRNGRMDFYHRGGRLFSYRASAGFSTHQKYASILPCGDGAHYVTEADLKTLPRIESFTQRLPGLPDDFVYTRIKENCAKFAGAESSSASRLYHRFSCTTETRNADIVVLDIEISFQGVEDANTEELQQSNLRDRVDLLLLNNRTRELRFVEAKSFTNGELRAKLGQLPKVCSQLKRYRKQLQSLEQRDHILEQYRKHVDVVNQLFGSGIPLPESIDPEPRLYIFDFDADQKAGRLAQNIERLRDEGFSVYAKGNPKDVNVQALWKKSGVE